MPHRRSVRLAKLAEIVLVAAVPAWFVSRAFDQSVLGACLLALVGVVVYVTLTAIAKRVERRETAPSEPYPSGWSRPTSSALTSPPAGR